MFALLKHVISIVIWAVVAGAFLLANSPELFAFWVLFGFVLVVAWIVKFIWKWIIGIFFPTVMARSYFFFVLSLIIIALTVYQLVVVPRIASWGVSDNEAETSYPIDEFLPNARTVTIKAFTIDAPVEKVYPWIKQLAAEGVLNFNVSILDIIQNKPAKIFLKDLPSINIGDRFLIGEIVQSEENRGMTIELNRQRFPWSKFNRIYAGYYLFREDSNNTRVVIKIKADYAGFLAWFSSKYLIELGDFWVSRYHLNTIKLIVENSDAQYSRQNTGVELSI